MPAPITMLLFGVALIVAYLFFDQHRSRKRYAKALAEVEATPYEVFAEGIFDKAERCKKVTTHSERTGSMVHTTRQYATTKHWTAIYLEDGRSWVFKGHINAPFPKGVSIRIMERSADADVYIEEARK